MNPAKYNRRIKVQYKHGDTDPDGFPVPEWRDVATVWALKQPLKGRTYFQAAAVNHEGTIRYEIRYREGVQPKMRVMDKDRFYEIYDVLEDVDGKRRETHVMCKETKDDGKKQSGD